MSKEVKIVRLDTLANGSIASIDRENGILYLNDQRMSQLSRKQQEFVILHEFAHYELNTSDEIAADNYAAQIYFAQYGNLDEPIKLHKELLSDYHPRVLALKNFKAAKVDNLAPPVIAAGIGAGSNIFNGVLGLFASRQQGRDARAMQNSFERQSRDNNATNIELAKLKLKELQEGGVLGVQNVKILITGAIVLAAVIGLVLVLKDLID